MTTTISIDEILIRNASEDQGTGKGIHGEFKFSFAVSRVPALLPGQYKSFIINRKPISLARGQKYSPKGRYTINGWGHPLYFWFFARELDGPFDADDTGSASTTLRPLGTSHANTVYVRDGDLQLDATIRSEFASAKVRALKSGTNVIIHCAGNIPGRDWLDGNTVNGSVALQYNVHFQKPALTGTRWKIVDLGGGHVGLQCLGNVAGPQWLDGNTVDGSVSLAPETGGRYTGTHWRMHDVAGETGIAFECLGNVPGPKWLDGNTKNGKVSLAPEYGGRYTGAVWHVYPESPS